MSVCCFQILIALIVAAGYSMFWHLSTIFFRSVKKMTEILLMCRVGLVNNTTDTVRGWKQQDV